MNTTSNTALKLLALLWIAIAFTACQPEETGTWKNDKISSGKRSDFHQMNADLFKALKADDKNTVKNMLSEGMLEASYSVRAADVVAYRLKANDYKLLDEFYINNKFRGQDTIDVKDEGIQNYRLRFEAVEQEMYLAFFITEKKAEKWMITLAYARYKYGWRLTAMEQDKYTVNGQTAPLHFKQAKEQYAKKQYVAALNTILLCRDCMNPSSLWEYAQDQQIREFNKTLLDASTNLYKWPLVLNEVSTKPTILRIFTQAMDEGTFPMIYYKSSISVKDIPALTREHQAVTKAIGKMLPGIDDGKKYMQYQVYNEYVSKGKPLVHYDFIDTLKR